MISKLILHMLFVISVGSKYHFSPEITSCSLSHKSTIEQLGQGTTYKSDPSQANKRVGLIVQDLDSVLKGTTFLLTL